MSARPSAIAVLALIAWIAPQAATAQHAEGKPAAATAKTATTTAAAPAGSRETAPKKDDLKGALDRIDLEIAEMKKTPRPTRATSSAAPTPAAAPRVKLVWRTALSWPTEIGGTGDEAADAHDASHTISLTWR